MKLSLLSILLTLSFVSIAVFGIMAMNQEADSLHKSCIAAVAQGTDCSKTGNQFSFISFHFSAFEAFSLAIFLVFLILGALLGFGKTYLPVFQGRKTGQKDSLSFQEIKLSSWLALREKSPSLV